MFNNELSDGQNETNRRREILDAFKASRDVERKIYYYLIRKLKLVGVNSCQPANLVRLVNSFFEGDKPIEPAGWFFSDAQEHLLKCEHCRSERRSVSDFYDPPPSDPEELSECNSALVELFDWVLRKGMPTDMTFEEINIAIIHLISKERASLREAAVRESIDFEVNLER